MNTNSEDKRVALNYCFMGRCKRCRLLAKVNINDLCEQCVGELVKGQPNMHGEGPKWVTHGIA